MTAALSPGVSWLLVGACVGVAVTVYVAVAGGRQYRRMEEDFDEWRTIETWTEVNPADAHIRVTGGVYDAEARGDFE